MSLSSFPQNLKRQHRTIEFQKIKHLIIPRAKCYGSISVNPCKYVYGPFYPVISYIQSSITINRILMPELAAKSLYHNHSYLLHIIVTYRFIRIYIRKKKRLTTILYPRMQYNVQYKYTHCIANNGYQNHDKLCFQIKTQKRFKI